MDMLQAIGLTAAISTAASMWSLAATQGDAPLPAAEQQNSAALVAGVDQADAASEEAVPIEPETAAPVAPLAPVEPEAIAPDAPQAPVDPEAPLEPEATAPVAPQEEVPETPALSYRFAHVTQYSDYFGAHKTRSELLLFADGRFKIQMSGAPKSRFRGCPATADIRSTGKWVISDDTLVLEFADGFRDFGHIRMGTGGPLLYFHRVRWQNELVANEAARP